MTVNREKIEKGKRGEDLASQFLAQNGYRILERNYRNRFGEIDLIAEHDKIICFVEVKTRRTEAWGNGFEAVGSHKQRKMSQVALGYLKAKGLMNAEARFDVVSILEEGLPGRPGWQGPKVELIADAFPLTGPYTY